MPSGGKRLAQLYSDIKALRNRVREEEDEKVRLRMRYVIDRSESLLFHGYANHNRCP